MTHVWLTGRLENNMMRFHVDDIMSSLVNPKVNDKFAELLQNVYGGHKMVNLTEVNPMIIWVQFFDYNTPGKVKIGMIDYVKSMIEDIPEECLLNKFKRENLACYCGQRSIYD
jgi:hypothetical protein